MEPGLKSPTTQQISGECNKCGHCCEVENENGRFRCTNLLTMGIIGFPGATLCSRYGDRYDGMAIQLRSINMPGLSMDAVCHKNSQAEIDDIKMQIARGRCSLKIKGIA